MTDSSTAFRYDGTFPLEHLRDDELVRAAEDTPACVVVRDHGHPAGKEVADVILEPGDWFARHDDDVQTPLVVPKAVAEAIVKSCPREHV